MKLSNVQIIMLHDLIERELASDPNNIEWKDILSRLERMRAWRAKEYPHLGFPEAETINKVWGRDYV